MKKTKERLNILCLSVVMLMLVFLLYLAIADSKEIYQPRESSGYSVVSEYSYEEIADKNAPAGVKRVFSWELNEKLLHRSHFITFLFHNYVDVFIGDELVYSVHPSPNQSMTKTLGGCCINVPLQAEDIGKEIKVVVTPVYENVVDDEVKFYLGSEYQLYMKQMENEAQRIMLGVIASIIGLLFLVLEFVNYTARKSNKNLMAIGGFVMMTGIWAITDTWTVAIFFEHLSVALYYLSLAMLMFLMVPFGLYMKNSFGKKNEGIWMIGYGLVILAATVQLFSQLFQIKDIREMLLITHILLLGGVLTFLVESVISIIKRKKSGEKAEGNYFIICVIGVLIDLTAYYLTESSQNLIFSVLAFLIYFALSGVKVYKQYRVQEEELEESRVEIMLGQIRPHFIYNTLGTIRYLCLNNPERAASVVEDFSLYLRGSFGELGKKSVIPLSKEISHVQHYVDIEEVRFPNITVVFELESSDFNIPALSIQPLVENAIKHGLTSKVGGGTVTVKSYETDKAYYVSVEDDGAGFDEMTAVKNDGRKHIGLSNIRGRIEAMCDGTFTIESKVGVGTKAVICIPKEEV